MLKVGEAKEIYEMKGAGRSTRGIAQELDVSRNTVRRYLKSPEAMRPRPRPPRGSKLDPYAEHIDRRLGRRVGELQGAGSGGPVPGVPGQLQRASSVAGLEVAPTPGPLTVDVHH